MPLQRKKGDIVEYNAFGWHYRALVMGPSRDCMSILCGKEDKSCTGKVWVCMVIWIGDDSIMSFKEGAIIGEIFHIRELCVESPKFELVKEDEDTTKEKD